MKKQLLRRSFLKSSILASGGVVLLRPLESFANYPSVVSEDKFSPKCDIRKSFFGKQVVISGQVFDRTGKNQLKDVTIEFWHLSPNSKKINHRGKLVTGENGQYLIKSDFPSRELGKNTTMHFKLSKDEVVYETQLKFNSYSAFITDKHWEENNPIGNSI